ncbi:FtsX-like permease family protein [Dactylosporangium fulvum]|uniref:FtsX-like permease family protein n=1 Tax=Dactylosporangium fulvum TaxID=53359 RepID=A0ABY5WE89_9ACTN|nr:FtsX-like permease family protein [Dactylosporangium fulvum]UWP87732.1 FtsX-like permease family protein [Dactylosporangium fulvum]
MSWSTFRDRWQLFVGAMITVCFGVALVQSSLLALVAAGDPSIPAGLPAPEEQALREGYDTAAGLLGMIVALCFFIAVFIVSSTFAFTVAQRRRELALLRLTGASRRQIRRLLLGEALVLGLLGTAAGVVVGLPVLRLEVWTLTRLGFVPAGFTVGWGLWVLPFAAGTGVGVAVLGVLGASRRASRVRALDALRGTGRAATVMTWPRWIWGLFCLAGGIALITLAPAVGGEAALALSLLVCIVLVIAFSALSPLVVPLVGGLLGVLVRLSAGRAPLGDLAHANLRDGVRRSAATAAPILVLVGLVVGIGGTLGAVAAGSREEALRTLTGDLVVTTNRSIGTELAAVDGVGTASAQIPVTFQIEMRHPDAQPELEAVDGVAIDPGTYQLTHRLPLEAGSLDALRGDTVAVSSGYAPEQHWRVGDTLRVHIDDTPRDLRIVAMIPLRVAGPDFLLPDGVVPVGDVERRYMVRVDVGVDPAAVADRIRAAGLGRVSTVADFVRDDADEQQQNSLKVMVALLGMAVLYTVIAMVNAVVIAAADRTAEFATARLTGLTRRQVVRAALWESLAVVVVGLVLGGLAAAGTVTGVSVAVSDIVGTAVISVPWLLFAALFAGTALVVGVTSILTTLAATRQPAVTFAGSRE